MNIDQLADLLNRAIKSQIKETRMQACQQYVEYIKQFPQNYVENCITLIQQNQQLCGEASLLLMKNIIYEYMNCAITQIQDQQVIYQVLYTLLDCVKNKNNLTHIIAECAGQLSGLLIRNNFDLNKVFQFILLSIKQTEDTETQKLGLIIFFYTASTPLKFLQQYEEIITQIILITSQNVRTPIAIYWFVKSLCGILIENYYSNTMDTTFPSIQFCENIFSQIILLIQQQSSIVLQSKQNLDYFIKQIAELSDLLENDADLIMKNYEILFQLTQSLLSTTNQEILLFECGLSLLTSIINNNFEVNFDDEIKQLILSQIKQVCFSFANIITQQQKILTLQYTGDYLDAEDDNSTQGQILQCLLSVFGTFFSSSLLLVQQLLQNEQLQQNEHFEYISSLLIVVLLLCQQYKQNQQVISLILNLLELQKSKDPNVIYRVLLTLNQFFEIDENIDMKKNLAQQLIQCNFAQQCLQNYSQYSVIVQGSLHLLSILVDYLNKKQIQSLCDQIYEIIKQGLCVDEINIQYYSLILLEKMFDKNYVQSQEFFLFCQQNVYNKNVQIQQSILQQQIVLNNKSQHQYIKQLTLTCCKIILHLNNHNIIPVNDKNNIVMQYIESLNKLLQFEDIDFIANYIETLLKCMTYLFKVISIELIKQNQPLVNKIIDQIYQVFGYQIVQKLKQEDILQENVKENIYALNQHKVGIQVLNQILETLMNEQEQFINLQNMIQIIEQQKMCSCYFILLFKTYNLLLLGFINGKNVVQLTQYLEYYTNIIQQQLFSEYNRQSVEQSENLFVNAKTLVNCLVQLRKNEQHEIFNQFKVVVANILQKIITDARISFSKLMENVDNDEDEDNDDEDCDDATQERKVQQMKVDHMEYMKAVDAMSSLAQQFVKNDIFINELIQIATQNSPSVFGATILYEIINQNSNYTDQIISQFYKQYYDLYNDADDKDYQISLFLYQCCFSKSQTIQQVTDIYTIAQEINDGFQLAYIINYVINNSMNFKNDFENCLQWLMNNQLQKGHCYVIQALITGLKNNIILQQQFGQIVHQAVTAVYQSNEDELFEMKNLIQEFEKTM